MKPKKRSENPVFLNFPYINDSTDKKVKRILHRENLDVIIYNRNKTLRQALASRPNSKEIEECKLQDCPLKNPYYARDKAWYIRCNAPNAEEPT